MYDGRSTEVIVLDLRTEIRARREKVRAHRAHLHDLFLKLFLGAVFLIAASAVLFALLSGHN